MNRGKYRWDGFDLLHKLADLPFDAWHWMKNKAQSKIRESQMLSVSSRIDLPSGLVRELHARLAWGLGLQPGGSPQQTKSSPADLPAAEAELYARICRERDVHNRNNVTRTAAYLHLYREHPELHWALLAHMVSRNGGWSMTDLCGELLPLLLGAKEREHIFLFLERANAFIFRDAYPQLLLYRASLQQKRPLFHLLPAFGVSQFMRPIWDLFWQHRHSALLTIGLIVNEQHYIDSRIVKHPAFRAAVTDKFFFQAQSALQLNQVVFPYTQGGRNRLAGLTLENFSSLSERIEVGRSLYAMLFGIPAVSAGVAEWALVRRHTGSRSDYWPHLFTPARRPAPVPRGHLKERLKGCALRPGAAPFHSPALSDAWPDRKPVLPEAGDWHSDLSALPYFRNAEVPSSFDMTRSYCLGLNKIELAVLASDLFV